MRSTGPSLCLPFHLHFRTTHLVAHLLGGHKMLAKRLVSCLMVLKHNPTPATCQNGRKSSPDHNSLRCLCIHPRNKSGLVHLKITPKKMILVFRDVSFFKLKAQNRSPSLDFEVRALACSHLPHHRDSIKAR